MAPHERYQPTREEWEELRADVTEIKTALTGNSLGTKGVVKRVEEVEEWIGAARVRLAVIAALVSASGVSAWEAVKAWFHAGGHER